MRAYTLTEELALDEHTAGKLFPVLARFDAETDERREERGDVERRLRRAGALRDIDRRIDEAVANQRGLGPRGPLGPGAAQDPYTYPMTKLLVVLPAVERGIQNRLRKADPAPRRGSPSTIPTASTILTMIRGPTRSRRRAGRCDSGVRRPSLPAATRRALPATRHRVIRPPRPAAERRGTPMMSYHRLA